VPLLEWVTNESLFVFPSDKKYRIKAAHRVPDLGYSAVKIKVTSIQKLYQWAECGDKKTD
jgi:hypothetical protein